jgi:hypothetical protein
VALCPKDANDTGRAERAPEEIESLIASLSRAFGLGGRRRRIGDDIERARSAITWRVRHTGVFCQYAPSHFVVWRLDDRPPWVESPGEWLASEAPENGSPSA